MRMLCFSGQAFFPVATIQSPLCPFGSSSIVPHGKTPSPHFEIAAPAAKPPRRRRTDVIVRNLSAGCVQKRCASSRRPCKQSSGSIRAVGKTQPSERATSTTPKMNPMAAATLAMMPASRSNRSVPWKFRRLGPPSSVPRYRTPGAMRRPATRNLTQGCARSAPALPFLLPTPATSFEPSCSQAHIHPEVPEAQSPGPFRRG